MKKIFILFLLLFVFALPVMAFASDMRTGDEIYIGSDEVIEETLFAFGETVEIAGTIDGNAFVFANKVTISGTITGNLFVASENVEISGMIRGDLYAAGSTVVINAVIDQNLYAAGQYVTLSSDTRVNWEANIAASNLELSGDIGRNANIATEHAQINAVIHGNMYLDISSSAQFSMSDKAFIEKDLVINNGKDKLTISEDYESLIQGSIIYDEYQRKSGNPFLPYIFKVGALILVGLIFVTIVKEKIFVVSNEIEKHPFKSLLIGFAALILLPIVVLLLMLTIIGMPLALILLGIYLIYLYISIIWFSLFVGKAVMKFIQKKEEHVNPFWALFSGVLLTQLLFMIPYIGPIATLLSLLLGLGAMLLYKYEAIFSYSKRK